MRVTQVSYRELKSGPGFTHQAVEMTAIVDECESEECVLDTLRNGVRQELGIQPPPPPLTYTQMRGAGMDGPHTSEVETAPKPTVEARLEQELAAIGIRIRRVLAYEVEDIGTAMEELRRLACDLDPTGFPG